MTSDPGEAADDAYWRRPSGPTDAEPPAGDAGPEAGDQPRPERAGPAGAEDATRPVEPAATRPAEPAARSGPSPWQRPDGPAAPAAGPTAMEPPPPAYAGPPQGQPPPPWWRPPTIVQSPPPRRLPPQDLAALDVGERSARTLTMGVGMIAGAVTIIAVCLICSRLLF